MSENIYRQLQQRLDFYSMGFPATESGIELKILKYLFSEDDAKMFLSLSHKLEMTSSIASSLNQPLEKVAAHLDDMAERGLLFRMKKADSVKYAAIPFVHGLFEFQVKNLLQRSTRHWLLNINEGLFQKHRFYHQGWQNNIC